MVESEEFKKDTIKILLKQKDLWCERLVTLQATHHTVDLEEVISPICQQLYCAGQKSSELFREHIKKQLEDEIINRVQSK